MAARLRKELGVPVDEIGGHYGEFTVLVRGKQVMSGGSLGWLGVLPSADDVLATVRAALGTSA